MLAGRASDSSANDKKRPLGDYNRTEEEDEANLDAKLTAAKKMQRMQLKLSTASAPGGTGE
jgi:hypothetical protein